MLYIFKYTDCIASCLFKYKMVAAKVYHQGLLLAKITAGFEINLKMNVIYNRYIAMR